MKTRNGFVSNSSSSSFCCLTTKEISEKAIATLTDAERAVINSDDTPLFCYDLAGMEFVGYEASSNDNGHSLGQHYSEDCDPDRMNELDEAVRVWKKAVKEVGGENPIIEVDIDM